MRYESAVWRKASLRQEVFLWSGWLGDTHPTPISILWGSRLRRSPPLEAFVPSLLPGFPATHNDELLQVQ
ncbi:hypothetical protein [Desulfosporosinus shakirovi]|uniref:hypothetical protein n=1 Tax=Desulfosporosinus shakirovi TaxID=2885154 RepID=UPI001E5F2BA9|nr:hypothetical protein [Desulfosporosinus sp. SRJS8]MCB8817767.1 hypothetical protein [Desulfosporosinus sp. SRJS8]